MNKLGLNLKDVVCQKGEFMRWNHEGGATFFGVHPVDMAFYISINIVSATNHQNFTNTTCRPLIFGLWPDTFP